MNRRLRALLLGLLPAVSAAAAAGCYTVIRHPDSSELVAEENGERRACADCHVDSEFYRDAFDPHTYGFGPYATFAGWSDYYFRPWWYKDYWYYGSGGVAGAPVEADGRHLWGGTDRRPLGTGGMTPVFPGGTSQPVAPSAGSPTAGTPTPAKPAEGPDAEQHRGRDRRELGTPGKPPAPATPAAETPPPPPPPDSSGGAPR